MLLALFKRFRVVHFFGYGADSDPEMINSLTGREPKVVGTAILDDYELRVQSLDEISQDGINPRRILRRAWGNHFKSYVIVPKPGSQVAGTLFRMRLRDRHLVDKWEMVGEGWYDKVFVAVRLVPSGKVYRAETQQLTAGQQASGVADGLQYSPWLQPKHDFIRVAASRPR